ncbi:MAG TPA: diaminopimelate epimerase [Propionibacteriaceae bacterium]|nr:diaminopimelate epimerase [Propionibacteriaceae bacterium]
MRSWSFAKGHGTENDFVLLPDADARLDPSAADVRAICDRRTGVGADGLLRVVRARHVEGWQGDGDLWFMDYRNGDGSLAEMCGNGLRVFARYLLDEGLDSGPDLAIATRVGVLHAMALGDGRIRVSMGQVRVGHQDVTVTTADGSSFAATPVDVGNPHAVSFAPDLDRLALATAPRWQPAELFPTGVNLEFVHRVEERHIAMRVYERGVGETRSCGTGTVAAAAAASHHSHGDQAWPQTYRVDVPGGTVEVELTPAQAFLTGPAMIVAAGVLTLP